MSRPLAAALVLLAAAAAGLAALALTAAGHDQHLAYSPGIAPFDAGRTLTGGETSCQQFDLPVVADAVTLPVRSAGPGPPLDVLARGAGGRVIGRGSVAGGYASGHMVSTRVGPMPAGSKVEICVRNAGGASVVVPGENGTMDIAFLRTKPKSTLSLLGDALDRASVFRPGWVGGWTFWVLLALVGVGAPLVLARALAAAEREDLAGDDLDPVGTPRA
ncbi:MAG: hypothetical protein ACJ76V_05400 [Thermoleophilaceae bacterium]